MTDIIDIEPRAIVASENTPNAMLMIAVQRGDDMERLKQLMDCRSAGRRPRPARHTTRRSLPSSPRP
jgi:hypothetical protein